MTFRAKLDCWAALRLCRAGGEWDAPTLDAALGTEELQREWIAAAEARIAGWGQADEEGFLDREDAVTLGVVDALRRIMEGNSPKMGGRPSVQQSHHKFGDKGTIPAVMEAGLEVDEIMRRCGESLVVAEGLASQDRRGAIAELKSRTAAKVRAIGACVMRCHPRKGPYSGLAERDSSEWRHGARYRSIVSELCRFERFGTLDSRRWKNLFEPRTRALA